MRTAEQLAYAAAFKEYFLALPPLGRFETIEEPLMDAWDARVLRRFCLGLGGSCGTVGCIAGEVAIGAAVTGLWPMRDQGVNEAAYASSILGVSHDLFWIDNWPDALADLYDDLDIRDVVGQRKLMIRALEHFEQIADAEIAAPAEAKIG